MPLKKELASPNGQDVWRIFRIMAEFVEGFEVMAPVGKAVSIFGSARTRPHDPYYVAAEQTSRLLAQKGFAVITGGGPGIMEAGNKGAYEAGGRSIGLNISLPHEQEANRYQTTSLDFHYFYARKVMFVKYASAFICFPGGYGTLDEFFETLTLIQTLKIEPMPIVLFGKSYWSGLHEWMKRTLTESFVDPEDLEIYRITDSVEQAVRWITAGTQRAWWRPRDQALRPLTAATAELAPPVIADRVGARTGEGTRYGQRPRHLGRRHAKPTAKPQQ
jgi:uncharacterized protein (TIGR00730 family)